MSTPPKRHLPDLQYTQHQHGGDQAGPRYGSTGDVVSSRTRQHQTDDDTDVVKGGKTVVAADADDLLCSIVMNRNNNSVDGLMADSYPNQRNTGHLTGPAIVGNTVSGASESDTEEFRSDSSFEAVDSTLSNTDEAAELTPVEHNENNECLYYGNGNVDERTQRHNFQEAQSNRDNHQRSSVALGIDKNELLSAWKRITKNDKPIAYSSESDDPNDETDTLSIISGDSAEEPGTSNKQKHIPEAASEYFSACSTQPSKDSQSEYGRHDGKSDKHSAEQCQLENFIKTDDIHDIEVDDNSIETLCSSGDELSISDTAQNFTPSAAEKTINNKKGSSSIEVKNNMNGHVYIDNTHNYKDDGSIDEIVVMKDELSNSKNFDFFAPKKSTNLQKESSNIDGTNSLPAHADAVQFPQCMIEEVGAIGGESAGEHITGILHRRSSGHRRVANVHFSNEVLVENTSQTDSDVRSSNQGELAHGDGPPIVPLSPPIMPSISSRNPEHPPRPTQGTSGGTLQSDKPTSLASPKTNIYKDTFTTCNMESNNKKAHDIHNLDLHMKASVPRVVSPTELLRMKQKAVTNKIIKGRQDEGKMSFFMDSGKHKVTEAIQKASVNKENYFQSNNRSNANRTFIEAIQINDSRVQSTEIDDTKIIEKVENLPNPAVDEGFNQFPNVLSGSKYSFAASYVKKMSKACNDDDVPGTSDARKQEYSKSSTVPEFNNQQNSVITNSSIAECSCFGQGCHSCKSVVVNANFTKTGARPKTIANRSGQDVSPHSGAKLLSSPLCYEELKYNTKRTVSVPKNVTISSQAHERYVENDIDVPISKVYEHDTHAKSKRKDSTAIPWENKMKVACVFNDTTVSGILEQSSDTEDDRDVMEQCIRSGKDYKHDDTSFTYKMSLENEMSKQSTKSQCRDCTARPWETKKQEAGNQQLKFIESISEQKADTDIQDIEQENTQTGMLVDDHRTPTSTEKNAECISLATLLDLLDKINSGDMVELNDISSLVEAAPNISWESIEMNNDSVRKKKSPEGAECYEDDSTSKDISSKSQTLNDRGNKVLSVTSFQKLLEMINNRNNVSLNDITNIFKTGVDEPIECDNISSTKETQTQHALLSALSKLLEKIKCGDLVVNVDEVNVAHPKCSDDIIRKFICSVGNEKKAGNNGLNTPELVATEMDQYELISDDDSNRQLPDLGMFRNTAHSELVDTLHALERCESSEEPGAWFVRKSCGELVPLHSDTQNVLELSESCEQPGYWFFKKSQESIVKQQSQNDMIDNIKYQPQYGRKQSDSIIYPTPSQLLRKINNREETQKASKSPGLGAFDYTTPSCLFEKLNDINTETIIDMDSAAFKCTSSPSEVFESVQQMLRLEKVRRIANKWRAICKRKKQSGNIPLKSLRKCDLDEDLQLDNMTNGFDSITCERTSQSVEKLQFKNKHEIQNIIEYFSYTSPSQLLENIQLAIDNEQLVSKTHTLNKKADKNEQQLLQSETVGNELHTLSQKYKTSNGTNSTNGDFISNEYEQVVKPVVSEESEDTHIGCMNAKLGGFTYSTPSELIANVQKVIDIEKVRRKAMKWRAKCRRKKIENKKIHDLKKSELDTEGQLCEVRTEHEARTSQDASNVCGAAAFTQGIEMLSKENADQNNPHSETDSENVSKWRDRCRRKERIDNLQRNVLKEVALNEYFYVGSASDFDVRSEIIQTHGSPVSGQNQYVSQTNTATEENSHTCHATADIIEPIEFMNWLVTKFLNMVQETEMLGLPFDEDSFEKLKLIYTMIGVVEPLLNETSKKESEVDQDHSSRHINVTCTNNDSGISFNRTQLEGYLGLLSSALLRMSTYLTENSESDLDKYGHNSFTELEKKVDNANVREDGEIQGSEFASQVTLDDILWDLDSVRRSTCSLLSDYGTVKGHNYIPHKISKDSIASGYAADHYSSDESLPDRHRHSAYRPVSHHGYEGDVSSSERTLPSQTVVHGWTFSNQFLDRTSPVKEIVAEDIAELPYSDLSELYGRDEFAYVYHKSPRQAQPEHDRSSIHMMHNPNYRSSDSEAYENEHERLQAGPSCRDKVSVEVSDAVTNRDGNLSSPPPQRKIRWSGCVCLPNNSESAQLDIGPSAFTVKPTDMYNPQEGSPDRGQRSFASQQQVDRRGDTGSKRKQPVPGGRGVAADARSHMMEKELMESQNRKLQTENSRLQTENKLLKEKHNRAQSRISDLETQLQDTQDDLNTLQENLSKEMSDMSSRNKTEIDRDRDLLQTKVMTVTKENESLKSEVSSLEKQLDSCHRVTDAARQNSEKTRTLDAHKAETSTLKEELVRVKALLDQSERHLRVEEERHSTTSAQVVRLTELKSALQQQSDTASDGTVSDKQLRSLEARLKVTEERLHQERADRANNLSSVEDKLLTENSRLQAVEKDMTRQLHREKDKNRNLEHRVKQIREENEKLRLAIPFDDSTLLSGKDKYDIPYSSHSNQRAESMKVSDDMNYIYSQIERQDGVQSNQNEEIIQMLWNKRELAYRQLRAWELQIEELQLSDNNNLVDGLKNLRDTYGQAESKLRSMEEKLEDAQAQIANLDSTYKQQLSGLVHERHEAFARLMTAEDILAAIKLENDMLHRSIGHGTGSEGERALHTGPGQGQMEALQVQCTSLEGKVSQLTRSNKLLEGEVTTLKVQLDAREAALRDCQGELELAYSRLQGDSADDRKQQKIDKLVSQVNSLQLEVKLWTDKCNTAVSEKLKVESELSSLKRSPSPQKTRQQKNEQTDSKLVQDLRDDLSEKDGELASLHKQLDNTDNQLHKLQQELYIEQEHSGVNGSKTHGPDAVISMLHHAFTSYSFGENECLIHADNCGGQNKNRYVIAYFAWRVMTGKHQQITYMMQVPGHARCLVDSNFAHIKRRYKRSDVDSLLQLRDVVDKSACSNTAVMYGQEDSWHWCDWKGFLGDVFLPMKGIRSCQVFRFHADHPGVVFTKSSAAGEEKRVLILRKGCTVDTSALPTELAPGGIDDERRHYLFTHIRKFVRDPWKDLTCPPANAEE